MKRIHVYSKNRTNQKKIIFGLFGAGGFAREVMPFVTTYISSVNQSNTKTTQQIYFVEKDPVLKRVNGYPVISEKEFFELDCGERFFNIAIGDSKKRERIANECIANGAQPMSVWSPHSINYDCNEVGVGAIMCAHTMVTSNAKIGKFFHLNINSYVAHDCVIGNYVTFAPNVQCNGRVNIHDYAYIGTGVIIKQGSLSKPIVIGEGAVLGMGAVVTKDVLPFSTVVGNPAKPLSKN